MVHPWARATPGGTRVGGVYFEMKAARGHADRLIAARTAAAGSAELHKDVVENGIAKMRRVDAIPLRAGPAAFEVVSGVTASTKRSRRSYAEMRVPRAVPTSCLSVYRTARAEGRRMLLRQGQSSGLERDFDV